MPALATVPLPRHSFWFFFKAIPSACVKDYPVLLLFFLRLLEEFYRWWLSRRRFNLSRLQVLHRTDEVDFGLIQGCLLSTEELVNMGRVEKRTLFQKPLAEVLGGNRYLMHELLRTATLCRQRGRNCLVMRLLGPDEKYQILQDCLNAVSSLFGPNFVHFNALGSDEHSNAFKSTWYCLTVMTPTRPERIEPQRRSSSKEISAAETCTFTDMTRMPRATLRIALVNESELRRIADGKLRPPTWGFFNSRHAERYRMLTDFAANFQKQLLCTSADGRKSNERNPFTSEKVYHPRHSKLSAKPDGGAFHRVTSVPNMSLAGSSTLSPKGRVGFVSKDDAIFSSSTDIGAQRNMSSTDIAAGERTGHKSSLGLQDFENTGGESNCFLRCHVPHYMSPAAALVVRSEHGLQARDGHFRSNSSSTQDVSGMLRTSFSSNQLKGTTR